jgi:hypothetical protein
MGLPDQFGAGQQASTGVKPSLLEPGVMPTTNGGLLVLGAAIAIALLARRTALTGQDVAAGNLSAAAEAYRKAEEKLVSSILEADKNDVGRNEIARRVDGIYSRQTVLTLLGSADLVQRSAATLDKHNLTGNVRIWQGKRQRLLMELADTDLPDDARLQASQDAVNALAEAGIGVRNGSSTDPTQHLAAGKVLELIPSAA